jgi:hypothetical protein
MSSIIAPADVFKYQLSGRKDEILPCFSREKKLFYQQRWATSIQSHATPQRTQRKTWIAHFILSKKGDVLAGFMASSRRCGGA